MKKLSLALVSLFLISCGDPNDEPKYGELGLPSNCRAYVQASIDAWRNGEHDTEVTMNALERNCGTSGYLWDE